MLKKTQIAFFTEETFFDMPKKTKLERKATS